MTKLPIIYRVNIDRDIRIAVRSRRVAAASVLAILRNAVNRRI
jgi:hypothetical protein